MRSLLRHFDISTLRLFDSPDKRKPAGFSLIEVNIAILVIAGGLLSLFALFPAGLRMSSSALSETRQTLFADAFFAFFDAGVQTIQDRDDWQDVDKFWNAAKTGLNGFKDVAKSVAIDKAYWQAKANERVRKDWGDATPLVDKDFIQDGVEIIRYGHGIVTGCFAESNSSGTDNLDAEFLVRIASDYDGIDGLIWRVSLVVSDDGEGGWYYDNPVFHRDFRYAELP